MGQSEQIERICFKTERVSTFSPIGTNATMEGNALPAPINEQ